jgi:predicted TIM-barrel fold metal-dependent hydrolase
VVLTEHRAQVGERKLRRVLAAEGTEPAVRAILEKVIGLGPLDIEAFEPGTQPLAAVEAVPLARDANDFLADAVRAHPQCFAAFATLPTPDPAAAARELERCVQQLGMVGAQLVPLTAERYLDHESFRPVFEAAAALEVPRYIHPGQPLKAVSGAIYGGFDEWTNLNLSTGGWGWHIDAGLATLRLILAGTFDRHPDLQIVLGRWGETLVPFADRADLLSEGNTTLQRRVVEYITDNIYVTAGGVLSHRMLSAAVDVLGADRVMFGDDDPYRGMKGAFAGPGGATEFVETAPLSEENRRKLGHLNAERLLKI